MTKEEEVALKERKYDAIAREDTQGLIRKDLLLETDYLMTKTFNA